MKMSCSHNPCRGQTSLEYLLLLAVVAVVVIASFRQGALISQVHDSAQGYYNSITRVILGENPQPINGGWCQVICPPPGSYGTPVMYETCACPEPAFGGDYCSGSGKVTCQGVTACSCPPGQQCLPPDGHCGCPNNLICGGPPNSGPKGSITSTDCSQCICPLGSTYDYIDNACDQRCPAMCTTWNGTACVPVVCPTNMTCNPNATSSSVECACNQGTKYVGPGCAYCTTPINGQCSTSLDGQTCVGQPCPSNLYCDTTPGDPYYNQCRCPSPTTCWNGSLCVNPSGDGSCNCTPTTPCPSSNGCGTDSCGNVCGTCSGANRCSATDGTPGTCGCAQGTGCGKDTCGPDTCGNPNGCGVCASGTCAGGQCVVNA